MKKLCLFLLTAASLTASKADDQTAFLKARIAYLEQALLVQQLSTQIAEFEGRRISAYAQREQESPKLAALMETLRKACKGALDEKSLECTATPAEAK